MKIINFVSVNSSSIQATLIKQKKWPCLAGPHETSYQTNADSDDRDKPIGNLAQT